MSEAGTPVRFVLGSSSPRRHSLLRTFGVGPFMSVSPAIDETQRPGEAPIAYVERMAREKALAVAVLLSPGAEPTAILTADTIVIAPESRDLLGKPRDAAEARAMLERLRGKTHTVCTAVGLLRVGAAAHAGDGAAAHAGDGPAAHDGDERVVHVAHEQIAVTMRDYTDDEIAAYIASGDPFDKAGAYAIQHPGFRPVAHIEGSQSGVVGLPETVVRRLLDTHVPGWRG
jgi:septum formation protein